MSHTTTAGSASFGALVLHADKPVLVDFWAPWCGPCKQMEPALEQAAKQLAGKVDVVKVDIDASPDLAQEYAITSVPTLVLFKGGEVVYEWRGPRPARQIVSEVKLAL